MAGLLSGERQANSCSKTRYCLLATPCSYRPYIDHKVQGGAAVDSKKNFFSGTLCKKNNPTKSQKGETREIYTNTSRTYGRTDGRTDLQT